MMTINFEHLDHTICLSQVYLGVHSGLKLFFSAILYFTSKILIFLTCISFANDYGKALKSHGSKELLS